VKGNGIHAFLNSGWKKNRCIYIGNTGRKIGYFEERIIFDIFIPDFNPKRNLINQVPTGE
jgi:hypothetical protein